MFAVLSCYSTCLVHSLHLFFQRSRFICISTCSFASPTASSRAVQCRNSLFFCFRYPQTCYPTQLLTLISADHNSVIHAFESMQSAGCSIESSTACMAMLASAALNSASSTDLARLHWAQYTRRYLLNSTQMKLYVTSCKKAV